MNRAASTRSIRVSPRFGGGSGLKLMRTRRAVGHALVSPRFGGGSGLKLRVQLCDDFTVEVVSPRFGGGSGLKLLAGDVPAKNYCLPSLRRGEWIETLE